MSGAKTGDWVRAREDSRDAEMLEGVLHLRYVPSLQYVQVLVHRDGRMHDVDPDSIEVLRSDFTTAGEVEAGDPLIGEPGWRRVEDLGQVRAEGLVHATRVRAGGTWSDMRANLDRVVSPLVEAGWARIEEYAEESWEFGDSVAYDFERGDDRINVELYEHGDIYVYRLAAEQDLDLDVEPSPPLFVLQLDESEAVRQEAFGREGWLDPPPSTS